MRRFFFQKINTERQLALLILVLFVSIFLNFYRLGDLPREPYSFDMIHDINRANSILKGRFVVFFPENNFPAGGVEVGFYYLSALVSLLTKIPVSFLLFKIISASLAVISTMLLFILISEEFDVFVAALTSLYFTVSSWLFLIVRIAYRGITLIPLIILIILFFSKFSKRKQRDFVLLGVILSLGIYFNAVFMFILLIVFPLLLLITFLSFLHGGKWRNNLLGFAVTCITFFVLCSPILRYAYLRPNVFFGRIMYRNFERKTAGFTSKEYLQKLASNYQKVIFNIGKEGTGRSFPHYVNSYPGAALLSRTVSLLFLAGFLIAMFNLFKKRKTLFISLVLLVLIVFPLPNVLFSTGFEAEIPDVFRLVLGIIPTYIIIAFVIDSIEATLIKSGLGKKAELAGRFLFFFAIFTLTFMVFKENLKRNYVYYPRQYAWQNFPFYEAVAKEVNNSNSRIFINMHYPFDREVYAYFVDQKSLQETKFIDDVNKIKNESRIEGDKFIVISDNGRIDRTGLFGECSTKENYSQVGLFVFTTITCRRSIR